MTIIASDNSSAKKNILIFSLLISICIIFSNNCFSQTDSLTSFKKYKNTTTGAVTAYADGITQKKSTWTTGSWSIKPYFLNSKYLLKLKIDTYVGDDLFEGDLDQFCFMNENHTTGTCVVYMYIKIDDTNVIQIPGHGKQIMGDSPMYAEFNFWTTKANMALLGKAKKIEVKISKGISNNYDDFKLSYSGDELKGFKDFAIGMGF